MKVAADNLFVSLPVPIIIGGISCVLDIEPATVFYVKVYNVTGSQTFKQVHFKEMNVFTSMCVCFLGDYRDLINRISSTGKAFLSSIYWLLSILY